MLIGYARVSTSEQDTTMQRDALRAAGVRRVFEEHRSGATLARREQLAQLLGQLRPGDTVVVYKLDRLARSLSDLLVILGKIEAAGSSFRSLTEALDTSTPAGRMLMHLLGSFAEFERSMIRERSIAGQAAAMARGVHCGRPRALSSAKERQLIARAATGQYSKRELAMMYGTSISTVKRTLARAGLDTITEAHAHGVRLDQAMPV